MFESFIVLIGILFTLTSWSVADIQLQCAVLEEDLSIEYIFDWVYLSDNFSLYVDYCETY